jgi:hypothetical protein
LQVGEIFLVGAPRRRETTVSDRVPIRRRVTIKSTDFDGQPAMMSRAWPARTWLIGNRVISRASIAR